MTPVNHTPTTAESGPIDAAEWEPAAQAQELVDAPGPTKATPARRSPARAKPAPPRAKAADKPAPEALPAETPTATPAKAAEANRTTEAATVAVGRADTAELPAIVAPVLGTEAETATTTTAAPAERAAGPAAPAAQAAGPTAAPTQPPAATTAPTQPAATRAPADQPAGATATTKQPPTAAPRTEPADTAVKVAATEPTTHPDRPALRRAPGRTGGVVAPTRTPGNTRPGSASRPPADARPPAGPAEPLRPAAATRAPASAPPTQPPPPAKATRSTLHRRRLVVLVVFVLLTVAVLIVGRMVQGDADRRITSTPVASAQPEPTVEQPTATQPAATTAPETAATPPAPADAADAGPTRAATDAFTFAAGYGPVLGESGPVRRFKVAVEKSLGQGNGGDFADEIDRTLGDPRSWIAAGQYRLQRVPRSAGSEFTVYLASAKSSERMCATGGLRTAGYTSCRLPGQVIINHDRWQDAVPDYDAPLGTYRAYAINHEVGHQLGHGHEACPGPGEPAPVMQQQTYGLKGCVANAWPYLDGKRYSGRAVE